jgi:hypothetical protein
MEKGKKIFVLEGIIILIAGLFFGLIGMFTTLLFGFASSRERK